MSMHQEVACRYPTGNLQATRAARHHDHGRRRVRLWLSTAARRPCRRLWTSRGLLGWVVVAGGCAPSVDGRTPWGGVLPAHNGHAARSGADAGPTTASGRNQLRPGYGRPRSRKTGWAGTGPVPGPDASRPWQRLCARPRRGAAHTGGWVNPLSGCAHRGRVALARQLSPRPVACCCPQRLAPLCATDTRHACGTFQLTHGAPRPT
mgnify:CR=1 FL=1